MRIADNSAFLEHKRLLTVPLNKGDSKNFVVTLNFSVGTYYKIIALIEQLNTTTDDNLKIDCIVDITTELLYSADESITKDWVIANISFENQMEIVNNLMSAADELLNAECYKVPTIEVKSRPAPAGQEAKDRQKIKDEIDRLTKILNGKQDVVLMDDITLVMTETNNSYSDIMRMPILIFKDLVRTIIVNNKRTNDDYNLAYLKNEYEKIKDRLNSGLKAEEKPAQKKGADLNKLKAMLK